MHHPRYDYDAGVHGARPESSQLAGCQRCRPVRRSALTPLQHVQSSRSVPRTRALEATHPHAAHLPVGIGCSARCRRSAVDAARSRPVPVVGVATVGVGAARPRRHAIEQPASGRKVCPAVTCRSGSVPADCRRRAGVARARHPVVAVGRPCASGGTVQDAEVGMWLHTPPTSRGLGCATPSRHTGALLVHARHGIGRRCVAVGETAGAHVAAPEQQEKRRRVMDRRCLRMMASLAPRGDEWMTRGTHGERRAVGAGDETPREPDSPQ